MAKGILRVEKLRERLWDRGLDLDLFTLAGDGETNVLVYSMGAKGSAIVVIEDDELSRSTVKYLKKKDASKKLP